MVALLNKKGKQDCAGSLIASKYVISAAHCMLSRKGKPIDASDIKV